MQCSQVPRLRSTLNACPTQCPAAARRTAFTVIHEACITVNQINRMSLHILLVASGLSGLPVAEQAVPRNSPGLSAPERKAGSQKQVVCPRKLR